MKKFFKLSLLSLLLFACKSKAMEEQKSAESITSVKSGDQKEDKQNSQKIAQKKAEIIENQDYASLKDLEDSVDSVIELFEGDKKQFARYLLEALTNKEMLVKIRNINLLTSMNSLFDDNISKFDPSKTLKEEIDENNSEVVNEESAFLVITELPQEIIAHILTLLLVEIAEEDFGTSLEITRPLAYINFVTNICKTFYLYKDLLLNKLKSFFHLKTLNTVLSIGALNGYNNIVQILVNSGEVNIDEMNKLGLNPLLQVLRGSNTKLAKFLLKARANIDVKDNDGDSPLIYAIQFANEKMVTAFIKEGVNFDSANKKAQTPLQIARDILNQSPKDPTKRKNILKLIEENSHSKKRNDEKELEN